MTRVTFGGGGGQRDDDDEPPVRARSRLYEPEAARMSQEQHVRARSGTYAQEKMAGLYSEMGLTQGMAGMQ